MEADDAQELLWRCRQGEEEAWYTLRQLFERVARRVLADRFRKFALAEREEVQGLAFVKLVAAIKDDRVTATSRFQLVEYVREIVTNCAHDVWRKRQPTQPLPPNTVPAGPGPGDEAQIGRRLDCVRETVRAWPFADRLVVEMKLAGFTAGEIRAEARRFDLSLTSGAIHLRWFRLLRKLRHRCG